MGKFEKAVDFYLRGFNSKYIKRRTDISMQSLLKQLLAKGVKYTKDDVANYQIAYIRDRYTDSQIEDAYHNMVEQHVDPYKASRGRNVEMLGCGFGQYPRVLKSLLGDDVFLSLQNARWKEKQVATMQSRYGVSNVFEKKTFDTFVTKEAVADGRLKRTETLLSRYGVDNPNAAPHILAKMEKQLAATNMERYGVPNAMQNSEIAAKSSVTRQATMLKKYGFKNSVEVKEFRDKIFEARRQNKTLNSSSPEILLGDLLRAHFGDDDVLHNVVVDNRYPYHVDYYIKSLDLFIELNGDRSHNEHWFDESNPRDAQMLRSWTENMVRLEAETGRPSRYRRFIRVWTVTDVAKRVIAKQNGLNYLVFWDGSSKKRNKKPVPTLSDVYDWFDAGCPMPRNWLAVNTY